MRDRDKREKRFNPRLNQRDQSPPPQHEDRDLSSAGGYGVYGEYGDEDRG